MAGNIIADKWQNGDGSENYKCRAWVNFNGTGTVAIRQSGNVSSVTDEGVGIYKVNFITPMSDNNYAISGGCSKSDSTDDGNMMLGFGGDKESWNTKWVSNSIYIHALIGSSTLHGDPDIVTANIFR